MGGAVPLGGWCSPFGLVARSLWVGGAVPLGVWGGPWVGLVARSLWVGGAVPFSGAVPLG